MACFVANEKHGKIHTYRAAKRTEKKQRALTDAASALFGAALVQHDKKAAEQIDDGYINEKKVKPGHKKSFRAAAGSPTAALFMSDGYFVYIPQPQPQPQLLLLQELQPQPKLPPRSRMTRTMTINHS